MQENIKKRKLMPSFKFKHWQRRTVSMIMAIVMLFTSAPVFTTTLAEAVTNATDSSDTTTSEDSSIGGQEDGYNDDAINYDEIIETKPLINALNDGDSVAADAAKLNAFKATTDGNVVWTDADCENTANETLSLVKMYKKADSDYYFYLPETANLKALPIFFCGYSSVKIGTYLITSGTAYNFTGGTEVSVNGAKAYRFALTLNGTASGNLTFMQSSSPAMYLELGEKLPVGTNAKNAAGDAISNKDAFETKGSFMVTETVGEDKYSSPKGVLKKLKGRGNASWTYSYTSYGKYSFNITLAEKTKLFANLNKGKKFCLLANNADESFMHNVFSFELGKKLGLDFTPTFEYIDLYDSGDYMGSYMIIDKIEIDEQAVNLSVNLDDENEDANATNRPDGFLDSDRAASYNGATASLTVGSDDKHFNYKGYKKWVNMTEPELTRADGSKGAYLLELDYGDRFANEISGFISTNGQPVVVKYPEYTSKNQIDFISEKYNALETLLNTGNATYEQINAIIDVESFIKVYLIQELSKNCDSAASSYYIYYDPAIDTRLHAGPLWDFDMGYGQLEVARAVSKTRTGSTYQPVYGNQDLPTGWHSRIKNIDGDSTNTNFVLDSYNIQAQIVNNAAVWGKVESYFKRVNGFYDNAIGMLNGDVGTEGTIPYYINKLNGTAAMNESRWGFIASDVVNGFTDTGDTYEAATNFFVDWTKKRLTWLNGDEQESTAYARKGAIERNDPREIYELKYNYDATTYKNSRTNATETIDGFEGNRYVVFDSAKASTGNFAKTTSRMTWSQARDFCEKLGGHLVTFTSMGEWEFVQDRLIKNKEVAFLGGYDHDSYMTTINPSNGEDLSNRFKWVTDEPFYSSIALNEADLLTYTQDTKSNEASGFYNIVDRWKKDSTDSYGFAKAVHALDVQMYMVTCSTVSKWADYNVSGLNKTNYGWNDVADSNAYVTSFVCEFEEHEFVYNEEITTGDGRTVTKEHRYVMYDSCGEYLYTPAETSNANTNSISKTTLRDKSAFRTGASWELAAEIALRKGGHLATFTSADEYKVMQQLMVKNDGIRAWLGGYGYNMVNNQIAANKAKWKWITGETYNTALDYWEVNQPDYGAGPENFMATFSSDNPGIGNYELNDYPRWHELVTGFICEFETSQTYTWNETITRQDYRNGTVTDGPTRTIEHKYTLYMANMSWYEAQAYCENKGGHLATFTTKDEWEAVSSNLIHLKSADTANSADNTTYNTIYKDLVNKRDFATNTTHLKFTTNNARGEFKIDSTATPYYTINLKGYTSTKATATTTLSHIYRNSSARNPYLWLGGYDVDLYTDGYESSANDREWKWVTGEIFEGYKAMQYDVTTSGYRLNASSKDELCMATGNVNDGVKPYYWNDNGLRANTQNGNFWYHDCCIRGFVLETEREYTLDASGNKVYSDEDYNPIETTYKGNTYRLLDISTGNTAFNVLNADGTTTSYQNQTNGVAKAGYTAGLSWTDAEELCESLGGHLATFTTMEEWNVISDLMARSYYVKTWLGGFADNSTQTAGTTTEINSQNKKGFRWVTGENSNSDYPLSEFDSMWDKNQPDFSQSHENYMATGVTGFPLLGNCALNDYPNDPGSHTVVCAAVCEIEGAELTSGEGGSADAYSVSDSAHAYGTANKYISNYDVCNYQKYDYDFLASIHTTNSTNIKGSINESVTFTATPDDGYEFEKWTILEGSYESIKDASGNTITPNGETIETYDNITVTGASMDFAVEAVFFENAYFIKYDYNDDDGIESEVIPTGTMPETGLIDVSVQIFAPSRRGFTFIGWSVEDGLDTENAQKSKSNTSVAFTSWDGSKTAEVPNGNELSGDMGDIYFKNLAAIGETVELKANWKKNTYTIEFNLDGGSFATGTPEANGNKLSNVDYFSSTSVSQPSKVGHTFTGWSSTTLKSSKSSNNVKTNDTTPQISNNTSFIEWDGVKKDATYSHFKDLTTPFETVTLVANWRKNKYTVNFEYNDNDLDPSTTPNGTSKTVTYDVALKTTAPTRTGYTFIGWTSAPDNGLDTSTAKISNTTSFDSTYWDGANKGAGYLNFKNLTLTDNDSVTLYANWQINNYEVNLSLTNVECYNLLYYTVENADNITTKDSVKKEVSSITSNTYAVNATYRTQVTFYVRPKVGYLIWNSSNPNITISETLNPTSITSADGGVCYKVTFKVPAKAVNFTAKGTDIGWAYEDAFYTGVNGNVKPTLTERYIYWLQTGLNNGQIASPIFDVNYYETQTNTASTANLTSLKNFYSLNNNSNANTSYKNGSLVFELDSYVKENNIANKNKLQIAKEYLNSYKTTNANYADDTYFSAETSSKFSVNAYKKYNKDFTPTCDRDVMIHYYTHRSESDRLIDYISKIFTNYEIVYKYYGRLFNDDILGTGSDEDGFETYVLKGNKIDPKDRDFFIDVNNGTYLKRSELPNKDKVQFTGKFLCTREFYVDNLIDVFNFRIDYVSPIANSGNTYTIKLTMDCTDKNTGTTSKPIPVNYYGANQVLQSITKFPFGTVPKKADGTYQYSAAATYSGKEFSYWAIYAGKKISGTPIAKCYNADFNFVVFSECSIVPVYNGKVTGPSQNSVTISLNGYFRNMTSDLNGENVVDKVAADFVASYSYLDKDGNEVVLKNYDGGKIKCGIALEVCGSFDSDKGTDLSKYYDTYLDNTANVTAAIKANASLDKNSVINYQYGSGVTDYVKLMNKFISLDSLDNKNRIDYYTGYDNSVNNQNKIMKAYSYIIVDNGDGDFKEENVEVIMCDTPIVFVNFYDIGNKTFADAGADWNYPTVANPQ